MAKSLESVRRMVADQWHHLLDASKRLTTGFQTVETAVKGKVGGFARRVSDEFQNIRATTTGNVRHSIAYKQRQAALATIRGATGVQTVGEGGGPTTQALAAAGVTHPDPAYQRAASAMQQLRQPALEQIKEHDERKHYEALKKDTEQVTRHTTTERKGREEEEKQEGGEGKGSKTAAIAAATFELGRILTRKATEETSERAKFEEHLDKFAQVNGRIATAMSDLEVSRFKDRVAQGKVIEDVASQRIKDKQAFDEETAGSRAGWARFSEQFGAHWDAWWRNVERGWLLLRDKVITPIDVTKTIGNVDAFKLLEAVRLRKFGEGAEPPPRADAGAPAGQPGH